MVFVLIASDRSTACTASRACAASAAESEAARTISVSSRAGASGRYIWFSGAAGSWRWPTSPTTPTTCTTPSLSGFRSERSRVPIGSRSGQ